MTPGREGPRPEREHVTASQRALELAQAAAAAAADKLATDLQIIDVSEQLVITDCFVLAAAANDRQVRAVVDAVEERMRSLGAKPVRREGEREGRWVLLDYVDVVVHVQHADEREFYALERLWKDCPTVPLPSRSCRPRRRRPDAVRTGPDLPWRGVAPACALAARAYRSGTPTVASRVSSTRRWTTSGRAGGDRCRVLSSLTPALLISSDLPCARDRDRRSADCRSSTWSPEERLREIHLGQWQGLSRREARERFPEEYADWQTGQDVRRGGGETYSEVGRRAAQARSTPCLRSPTAAPWWRPRTAVPSAPRSVPCSISTSSPGGASPPSATPAGPCSSRPARLAARGAQRRERARGGRR